MRNDTLKDILFADNPWYLGGEVPPPGRILPIPDRPGIHRIWVPVGMIPSRDLKAMAYGWTRKWGRFSALFVDLDRVELPISYLNPLLKLYMDRLHASSERHLILVNAAHWIGDHPIEDSVDESYTVVLVYNVKPSQEHRVIFPYFPETPSPGEVKETFWAGDVGRALSMLRSYGEPLKRELSGYMWKYVIGFPPQEDLYEVARRMYSLIHEFYEIRDKEVIRKVLARLLSEMGRKFRTREFMAALNLHFETLRSSLEYLLNVGLIQEIQNPGREGGRASRIYLPASGQMYHLLKHTDPRDILVLDEESDEVLPFVLAFIVARASERGFVVSFADDGGKLLVFEGKGRFIVRLGEDLTYTEMVGLV
ncbi:MAG: hypothetical protein GXO39_04595 [Thermotogae bacterium]|nr:hypothetical protein [Thermotogota bacterium]